MKNILIITTLFLLSCGKPEMSACDCAQISKGRIDGKIEKLTKSLEEQAEIEADWDEKQAPCLTKIEESKEFEKEMGECLFRLLEMDDKKEIEEKKEE